MGRDTYSAAFLLPLEKKWKKKSRSDIFIQVETAFSSFFFFCLLIFWFPYLFFMFLEIPAQAAGAANIEVCPPCFIWSRQKHWLLKKSVVRTFEEEFYPIVFGLKGFKSPPEILDCFQPLQSLEVHLLLMEYLCCTFVCFWLIIWRLNILSLPWCSGDSIF